MLKCPKCGNKASGNPMQFNCCGTCYRSNNGNKILNGRYKGDGYEYQELPNRRSVRDKDFTTKK